MCLVKIGKKRKLLCSLVFFFPRFCVASTILHLLPSIYSLDTLLEIYPLKGYEKHSSLSMGKRHKIQQWTVDRDSPSRHLNVLIAFFSIPYLKKIFPTSLSKLLDWSHQDFISFSSKHPCLILKDHIIFPFYYSNCWERICILCLRCFNHIKIIQSAKWRPSAWIHST